MFEVFTRVVLVVFAIFNDETTIWATVAAVVEVPGMLAFLSIRNHPHLLRAAEEGRGAWVLEGCATYFPIH